MFLCTGRDTAEFTVRQKKGGEKVLFAQAMFKMESKLHSIVRKNNQGIWGVKKGKWKV